MYTITADPNDDDFGAVTGEGTYEHFEEVTLTAIPETGYYFVEWTEDGEVVIDGDEPAGEVYSFMAEEERDLVAHFTINTYQITSSSNDGGMVDPEGEIIVTHGEDKTFSVIPEDVNGYEIHDVLIDDESQGVITSYTFESVTQNHSIEAIFELKTYVITASAGEGGSIDPEGDVVVDHGDSQLFTITTDEGYEILDVLVDGDSVGAVDQYEFTDIANNHTFEAIFRIKTYVITASAGEGGSIDPDGDIVVDHGAASCLPSPRMKDTISFM